MYYLFLRDIIFTIVDLEKKISHLLLEYLETYYPKFKENEFEWKETVSKLAAKAGIHKLLKISGVSITKSEMETICSIKNKLLERLAFTMLCIAKFNNCKNPQNDGWVNTDIKDIFDYARIVCNSYERAVKIGELRQRGLLCFAKRSDSLNCRVTFIDDNFEEELFVSDFRELGYEYLKYKGGNFIRRNECGLLVRASKSDNGKYCRFCMSNIPTPKKTLKCVDCGISFEVDMKNHKTRRCKACSARRRRELIKQSVRNYREKQM